MNIVCECDLKIDSCKRCAWNLKRRSCYGHFPNPEMADEFLMQVNVCFICSGTLDQDNVLENQLYMPCCSLECALFKQTERIDVHNTQYLNECAAAPQYKRTLTKRWEECWKATNSIIFNGKVYEPRKAALLVRYGNNSISVPDSYFECPYSPLCVNPHHFNPEDIL